MELFQLHPGPSLATMKQGCDSDSVGGQPSTSTGSRICLRAIDPGKSCSRQPDANALLADMPPPAGVLQRIAAHRQVRRCHRRYRQSFIERNGRPRATALQRAPRTRPLHQDEPHELRRNAAGKPRSPARWPVESGRAVPGPCSVVPTGAVPGKPPGRVYRARLARPRSTPAAVA